MDVDISDILADISNPTAQQPSTSASIHQGLRSHTQQQQQSLYFDSQAANTDHQLLVRAWTSERCSPDLLPYPTSLIDRVMQRVRTQILRIEDLASGMGDPYTTNGYGYSHSKGSSSSNTNQNTNLILSILQTDLSRTQFLIRSFLRQRLSKITKYAMFYLLQLNDDSISSNPKSEINTLLSEAEKQFVRSHQSLLTNFYEGSFLSSLPPGLRRLDDSSGGVSMVEGPGGEGNEHGKAAVLVRCLAESWSNQEEVDAGGDSYGGSAGEIRAEVELRMNRGQVWVVRWADVRTGVVRGDLEVL